jgi:hypothetical protein
VRLADQTDGQARTDGGGTFPYVTNRLLCKYPVGTPNATEPQACRAKPYPRARSAKTALVAGIRVSR